MSSAEGLPAGEREREGGKEGGGEEQDNMGETKKHGKEGIRE